MKKKKKNKYKNKNRGELNVKRNIKDSVFTKFFKRKNNLVQLCRELYPEEKDIKERDIKILTLANIFTNDLYNDLGFGIKDRRVVLVEAQNQWSENIVFRALFYIVYTLKKEFDKKNIEIVNIKPYQIPEVEVYVVYTGKKRLPKTVYRLSEYLEVGENWCFDVKVKVIQDEDDSLFGQYIQFSRMFDRNREKMNNISEALIMTMKTCISKNILREYLVENQKEVISVVQKLFSQKVAIESYIDDLMEEKEAEMAEKLFSQKVAIESYIDELVEVKDQIIAEKEVELAENKILLFKKDNKITKLENDKTKLENDKTKLENDKTKLENDKIETIKNLINNQVGFSLEEIAKITNTNIEEVIKIKNEMQ